MSLDNFKDKARKLANASSDEGANQLLDEILAMAQDPRKRGVPALTDNRDSTGRRQARPKTTLRDKRKENAA